jgi:[ribosomal protein S5]-alanine N-acetyltransferase
MTLNDFPLDTERLTIRPLVDDDLDSVHRISNECFGEISRDARRAWLHWQSVNYAGLASVGQPPYGDRAIMRRADGRMIGMVGLVPSWGPFDLLPSFQRLLKEPPSNLSRPEMGLFWALESEARGQGYATEAARGLIDYAFGTLRLARIIATTEHDNRDSIAVMERLGMTVERNPANEPSWFQTVGVLWNE